MVGLAGCNAGTGTTGSAADPLAAPAADKYPIDPDGDGVEAKWSSETSRKDKWTRVANPDGGAELGVMDTAKIIQVDGYAFRDMNGNGKLDLWEDWRQPAEERARALAESLSIEEIDGLMWHPTFGGTGTPGDDVLEDVDKGMRVALPRKRRRVQLRRGHQLDQCRPGGVREERLRHPVPQLHRPVPEL